MNPVVVEVGPQHIRGPGPAPRERVSTAIDCIDDQLALIDSELVEVAQLWREVLSVVIGDAAPRPLVLLVPTWWPSSRIEVIAAAADDVAPEVVVCKRVSILRGDTDATVVELAPDLVVVAAPACEPLVLDRERTDVMAHLGAATSVLLDVPAGVLPLPSSDTTALTTAGIPLTHTDRHRVLRAAATAVTGDESADREGPATRPNRRVLAVLAGAVLSAAAVGGGWAALALSGRPNATPGTAVLVEGRVAVQVPAYWTVERITAGPGSARLQITEPGGAAALHVTQSTAATVVTLAHVAESLRGAMESESPGVFADFDPDGSAGGRPAVTYRERRAGSETDWAVVIDGATRIAVGCQSAAAQAERIRDFCAQAVRSAHVVR